MTDNLHPQVFAHRGARSVAPENTLPAFQQALDMGVDGIELDVQLSRDGQLVVIHDFTLERTTNGRGRVRDHTAGELAQLEIADCRLQIADCRIIPKSEIRNQKSEIRNLRWDVGVPTLEQVLDLVGDRCRLNVEIKTADRAGGRQEAALLAQMIQHRDLYEQVIVSSFNPFALIWMRRSDPRVALGLLYAEDWPIYLRRAWLRPLVRPSALHPHHTMIDKAYMQWTRSKGYAVNTWTVNAVEEARRLAGLGVDVLISDVPDRLMAALQRSGATAGH
ncbi:MAG: glycerophosphodiester phosphodiesterase [Anaerolineae bacterium]